MRDGQNKLIIVLMLASFLSVCTAVVLAVHKGQDSKHFRLPDPFQQYADK
jgi:hypothetical protein